jgi:hypothetical protein
MSGFNEVIHNELKGLRRGIASTKIHPYPPLRKEGIKIRDAINGVSTDRGGKLAHHQ